MGGKSRWDLIPFRSPFPVSSVSSQERDWQNDNTRCQAPLPTQRPSLRYQLLGWALRSTRHLPRDLPGLRDRETRKPSHGGQLLSELGSKSPSVLQKNIFQTGALSPRFEWMLNESPGTPVALLRSKLSEILCNESPPPFKVLFVWAFYFTAPEAHQKLIRKLGNRKMCWLICWTLFMCASGFVFPEVQHCFAMVVVPVSMKGTIWIEKAITQTFIFIHEDIENDK